jgi:hypothetical protein
MTNTDNDADELEYLRRAQAAFQFYRRVEARQADSEQPRGAPSVEPPMVAPNQPDAQADSPGHLPGIVSVLLRSLRPPQSIGSTDARHDRPQAW